MQAKAFRAAQVFAVLVGGLASASLTAAAASTGVEEYTARPPDNPGPVDDGAAPDALTHQLVADHGWRLIEELLGDRFAGAFLDRSSDQIIPVVAVAGGDALGDEALLRRRTGIANLQTIPVAYSAGQLDVFRNRLLEMLMASSTERKFENFSLGVDVPSNSIRLEAEAPDVNLFDRLRGLIPEDALTIDVVSGYYEHHNSSRDDYPPLIGGLNLRNHNVFLCTSGFNYRSDRGVSYGTTAGHCGRVGTQLGIGGTTLGNINKNGFYQSEPIRADVASFQVRGDLSHFKPRIYTGPDRYRYVQGRMYENELNLNGEVCFTANSYWQGKCGYITYDRVAVEVEGVLHDPVWCTSVPAGDEMADGDSGAPAYVRVGTSDLRAAGIYAFSHFSVSPGGHVYQDAECFQSAYWVQTVLNLNLLESNPGT